MTPAAINRTFLWIAGVAITIQFTIFKYHYPNAGFISGDSYVYLASAFYNSDINTYPIGYSKFLRIFSTFTRSDTALVAFQYLAIQAAALWLLYILTTIFHPRKLTKILLFVLVVFNPVWLYTGNYISSDAIFVALSLTWFTLLLKILKAPKLNLLIYQSLILLVAFMVRYNALYYPFIAALAIALAKMPIRTKLLTIGINFVLIALFISYTSQEYHELTGKRQFTPFSGWQLANNALYAYRYVDSADVKPPPKEFQTLDRAVRHYFDTTRDTRRHPEGMLVASTVYMWDPHSPLQKFMSEQTITDTTASTLKRWASMGPLYAGYGRYLIRQYPKAYFNYYLLPNALKYYTPPGEFLFEYNMGRDTVAPIAQTWFRYPTRKVRPADGDYKVTAITFMPVFAAVTNVVFLLGWLGLALLTGINIRSQQQAAIHLTLCLWIANFVFSVFASPVTLRYQLFAIVIFSFFALLLVDKIHQKAFSSPHSAAGSGPAGYRSPVMGTTVGSSAS